jgi:hypothetical protein
MIEGIRRTYPTNERIGVPKKRKAERIGFGASFLWRTSECTVKNVAKKKAPTKTSVAVCEGVKSP